MAFIVGAACGGGGTALGMAVGAFFDSLGEKSKTRDGLVDKLEFAAVSLAPSILGLVAWLIPFIGLPITITGFVFGRKALRSPQYNLALTGMRLSLLGLLLSSINAYLGAFLGAHRALAAHGP